MPYHKIPVLWYVVVGSRHCSEGFFSRFSGFPPFTKTNTSTFHFNLETVDDELLRGYANANSYLL